MHTVVVSGRLGGDPEMRYLQDGTAVTNFSLASNDYRGKNDPKHTTWFRCSAWGTTAETINQYATKGQSLLVFGILNSDENGNPRAFERKTGEPGASYEIRVDRFEFGTKSGDDDGGAAPTSRPVIKPVDEDEPF